MILRPLRKLMPKNSTTSPAIATRAILTSFVKNFISNYFLFDLNSLIASTTFIF